MIGLSIILHKDDIANTLYSARVFIIIVIIIIIIIIIVLVVIIIIIIIKVFDYHVYYNDIANRILSVIVKRLSWLKSCCIHWCSWDNIIRSVALPISDIFY